MVPNCDDLPTQITDSLTELSRITCLLNNRDEKLIHEKNTLSLINRVMVAANNATTHQELFKGALEIICEELEFTGGIIYLTNNKTREAKSIYSHNAGSSYLTTHGRIKIDRPPYRKIFVEGEIYRVNDCICNCRSLYDAYNILSFVCHPILSPCGIVGAIFLYRKDPPDISETVETQLLSITNYMGDALRRIWAEQNAIEQLKKYEGMFHHTPVAMWVKDFSNIKQYVDAYKEEHPDQSSDEFELYLSNHPEDFKHLLSFSQIYDINYAALEMYGVKDYEEFLKNTSKFFKGSSLDIFRRAILAIYNGDLEFTAMDINYTLNGDKIYVIFKWAVQPGYEATYQKVLISNNNITNIIRAEETIKEKSKKIEDQYHLLRSMCDNVPDMIWAKDTGKRYIFANKALCDKLLCAHDAHEPLGKDDVYFANRERESHPDDAKWHTFGELCQDSDQIILETLETGRFEEKGNVRGELLILDVYKAPFRDESGEVIGVVGCGRDITEQRLTESELLVTTIDLAAHMQELKATEEELQHRVRQIEEQANYIKALFSCLPVAITYKDTSGNYLDCNPAFCEMWGVRKEDIIGKDVSHIFPHESKQFLLMDEKCKSSKSSLTDTLSINYNGEVKKVHVVKTLHMGNDVTINGIITCMMEIVG